MKAMKIRILILQQRNPRNIILLIFTISKSHITFSILLKYFLLIQIKLNSPEKIDIFDQNLYAHTKDHYVLMQERILDIIFPKTLGLKTMM